MNCSHPPKFSPWRRVLPLPTRQPTSFSRWYPNENQTWIKQWIVLHAQAFEFFPPMPPHYLQWASRGLLPSFPMQKLYLQILFYILHSLLAGSDMEVSLPKSDREKHLPHPLLYNVFWFFQTFYLWVIRYETEDTKSRWQPLKSSVPESINSILKEACRGIK